jgi:hypothetical protein
MSPERFVKDQSERTDEILAERVGFGLSPRIETS